MALSLNKSNTSRRRWAFARHMLYDDRYVWLILASILDVVLTWTILARGGALEDFNSVLAAGGLRVLVAFKAFIITLVIVFCEEIGRRRPATGRRVADLAVAIAWIPVILGVVQLLTVLRPF